MKRSPRYGLFAAITMFIVAAAILIQPLSAAPSEPVCSPKANPNKSSLNCRVPGEKEATEELDPKHVKVLSGGSAGPEEVTTEGATLIYPDFTYRHHWGFKNGWWTLTLNDSRIRKTSNVFVSASEVSEFVSNVDPIPEPFVGAARFTVYDVAPRNGAVTIRLHINWSSPIGTQVSYLVLNP